jgi:hypothetical protein
VRSVASCGFGDLKKDWNSAAEREKAFRFRFAQRSIHPEKLISTALFSNCA